MENIEVTVARNSEQIASLGERVEKVEHRQDSFDKLVNSVSVMVTKQDNMECDLSEIKTDVKQLTLKSGKRFDSLLDKLLWLVAGGSVAYLIYAISGGTVSF